MGGCRQGATARRSEDLVRSQGVESDVGARAPYVRLAWRGWLRKGAGSDATPPARRAAITCQGAGHAFHSGFHQGLNAFMPRWDLSRYTEASDFDFGCESDFVVLRSTRFIRIMHMRTRAEPLNLGCNSGVFSAQDPSNHCKQPRHRRRRGSGTGVAASARARGAPPATRSSESGARRLVSPRSAQCSRWRRQGLLVKSRPFDTTFLGLGLRL